MVYSDILMQFAEHAGLDAQALLATEELVVNDVKIGLQLEGSETEGDILVFASLATPDAAQLRRVAPVLLQANHLWVGTGGATLGLHEATGSLTLCFNIRIDDELDGEGLAGVISAFVDVAAFWRKYVEEAASDEGTESPYQDSALKRPINPAFMLKA